MYLHPAFPYLLSTGAISSSKLFSCTRGCEKFANAFLFGTHPKLDVIVTQRQVI